MNFRWLVGEQNVRPAASLVVVLLLASGFEAHPQDAQTVIASVEDGLASIRAGDPLDGRISPTIAHDAVARIDRASTAAALYELSAIAAAGGAQRSLAAELVRLALNDPGAMGLTAFDLLRRQVPAESLDEAIGPSRREWDAALVDLVARDDTRAPRALSLLVRDAEPHVLLTCLASEATNAHRLQLLRDLETSRRPREVLEAFARVELDPALFEPFCSSLGALVSKHDSAATLVLDLVAQGNWGWGSALLRALGSLPPDLHDRAAPFVLHALETARGYHLAAAVIAATRLRLPELGPQLVDLARDPESRDVRVAAIRAIPVLRHRDPETIDLLIDLLADPEVSKEAHRALLRQSGVRIPLQREPWLDWRRRELPTDGVERVPSPLAPSVAPSVAPVVVARPADPGRTSRLTTPVVLLAITGTLVLLRWIHRRRARRAMDQTAAAVEQPAPTPEPGLSNNASRLERLGARLQDSDSGEISGESEAQLTLLRRALSDCAPDPSQVDRRGDAVLPPLDALRELQRLAGALEGHVMTGSFEVVRTSIERLEYALPGGGFTELGRECCFLLVQVAFQLSRGKTIESAVRERLLRVLGELDGHLSKAAVDPRTVDVAECFAQPPARAHGVSRSRTATLDHCTVDVSIAFPEGTPSAVPIVRPRLPKDASTLDVSQAFPTPPPVMPEQR